MGWNKGSKTQLNNALVKRCWPSRRHFMAVLCAASILFVTSVLVATYFYVGQVKKPYLKEIAMVELRMEQQRVLEILGSPTVSFEVMGIEYWSWETEDVFVQVQFVDKRVYYHFHSLKDTTRNKVRSMLRKLRIL